MNWPGLAIFAGSFLLFLVQPVLGKLLLPAHGGSAGVWTACLLFFQVLLVGGYAWAHYARPWRHLFLLAASLLWLPLERPYFRFVTGNHPIAEILVALAQSVGLPYVVLSANSSLIQRWAGWATPYRLYALSNAGSLAALLAYPILIEPWLALRTQLMIWSGGYLMFAGLAAAVTWRARGRERANAAAQPAVAKVHRSQDPWAWWIALSACGSALLMAVTNQMCQEIAPIPFLWIVPLVLYLISFIVCFDRPSFYNRERVGVLAGFSIMNACLVNVLGTRLPVAAQLATLSVALLVSLLVCHGELVVSRPPAERLTRFYLAVAAGGAAGGAAVALAAPRLFTRFTEFPLLMAATAVIGIVARLRTGGGGLSWNASTPLIERAQLASLLLAVLTCGALIAPAPVIDSSRNFYGTLRVTENKDETGRYRLLTHGATAHGLQYLEGDARRTPTAYYGWNSAAGQVLSQRRGRVGLVGLGVGTLARYGQAGDTYRVYELNPDVTRLARKWFTFLQDSAATIQIIEGDARLRLREEEEEGSGPRLRLDALVLDAFSSDSIPVHLLTLEAADLYKRRLAEDGILLIHISNRMLRLEPVVAAMARRIGFGAWRLDTPGDKSRGGYDAHWMILVPREEILTGLRLSPSPRPVPATDSLAWTDDFASVWRILER